MRLDRVLNELLGSQAKVRITRVVVTNPRLEHTGRELALIAEISQPQAKEALGVLETYGVVGSRTVGRAIVWRLNKKNYIYKELLLPLFTNEKMVLRDLKKELARTLEPFSEKVILFGSIAREGGGSSSDLDLCVVTKNKKLAKKALLDLGAEIARKYNIVVSSVIYSPKEYKTSKIIEGGEAICERG
ncbi:MAG: nucleotidyltransferase domain-containing protein [Candidatus Diapherotrites archaeon]|nr:nucleotidyltransferase domain-containing protein [Candidatus Diapherotrites archaeon]